MCWPVRAFRARRHKEFTAAYCRVRSRPSSVESSLCGLTYASPFKLLFDTEGSLLAQEQRDGCLWKRFEYAEELLTVSHLIFYRR